MKEDLDYSLLTDVFKVERVFFSEFNSVDV